MSTSPAIWRCSSTRRPPACARSRTCSTPRGDEPLGGGTPTGGVCLPSRQAVKRFSPDLRARGHLRRLFLTDLRTVSLVVFKRARRRARVEETRSNERNDRRGGPGPRKAGGGRAGARIGGARHEARPWHRLDPPPPRRARGGRRGAR